LEHRPADRRCWLQVARGSATLNDTQLYPGDGAGITDEDRLWVKATSDTEILLFDMG
jgi:hypothetical protein